MKRFEGGYARGGSRTLYMSRSDIVDTLILIIKGGFDLRALIAEARQQMKDRGK